MKNEDKSRHAMKTTILISLAFILSCCMRVAETQQQEGNGTQNLQADSVYKLDSAIVEKPFVPDDSMIIEEKLFKNLSYTHNFKLISYGYDDGFGFIRETDWVIVVYDKKNNLLDSVHQYTLLYSENIFKNPNNYRSFITGVNKNKWNLDHSGYFIVADFNFDKKEDFAIINEEANGGSRYSFYVQQDDNKFILDIFLTDSVFYCPAKIDIKNRRLTTYARSGCCWFGEHICELDKTNKWKRSYKEIDAGTGEVTYEKEW